MNIKNLEKIEQKIDRDIPLSKAEMCSICSENRRLHRSLKELLDAAQVALVALLRRATYNTETVNLKAVVAKHRSTGTSTVNGLSGKPGTAKYVAPL